MKGLSNGAWMGYGVVVFVQLLLSYQEHWKTFAVIWVLLILHYLLTEVELQPPAKSDPQTEKTKETIYDRKKKNFLN